MYSALADEFSNLLVHKIFNGMKFMQMDEKGN